MIYSFFIFILSVFPDTEKTHRVEVIDLTPQFKVFVDGKYLLEKEVERKPKTLYFYLDGERLRGNYLELESSGPFSLFINGMLAKDFQPGKRHFYIDSLAAQHSTSLSLSIYRENIKERIQAKVVAFSTVVPAFFDPGVRHAKDFSDFSIVASGFLFICFVFLVRVNPRVTLDYFNVVKLFSLQEREESLTGTKISASFNLLIYLFGCLLTSLLLLCLYHYSGQSLLLIGNLQTDNFYELCIRWVGISMVLFTGLFLKLILLYAFSFLFEFGEFLALQFLNFVRLIFFVCLLVTFLLLAYLILEVRSSAAYSALIDLLVIVLLLWLPLVFFKLLGRASNKMFHLFSYLCPSEIFPVLVLIKVLFF
jgi:hypothetical protein